MGRNTNGFTIVELLIVIVVVGILAALTVVGYSGMREKAMKSLLMADIAQITKKVEEYKIVNGSPPNSLNDVSMTAGSDGVTREYSINEMDWCLSLSKGNISYQFDSTVGSILEGSCFGLVATSTSSGVVSGVRTVVFVGEPQSSLPHYAFDFRPDATSYAYMTTATSKNTSAGVSMEVKDGLIEAYFARDTLANVNVGQRYSNNEKWNTRYIVKTYSKKLDNG